MPDSFEEHVKLMFDLQVLAFASDTTRVFSFKMGRDGSGRVYPGSGVDRGFHDASHHGTAEERIRQFGEINKYHVSLLPYFLEKLQGTMDGDASLLEKTLVMYGSPMAVGNTHNHRNCPLILLGRGGGAVAGRRPRQGAEGHADGQRDAHAAAPARTGRHAELWRQFRRVLVHGAGDDRRVTSEAPPLTESMCGSASLAAVLVLRPTGHATRAVRRAVGASMRAIAISLGVLVLASGLAAAPPDARVAEAAMRRDIEGVRTLLRGGADVNAAQGDGMTALHWASLNADLDTMNVLLLAGAATDASTRVGAYTPLHLASARGHAAAVARLIEAGGRVAAFTTTGVQPLHLAAQSGSAQTVTALLDGGADRDARDKTHGRTPLVFAASSDRVDVVALLLARGADARLTTNVIDYPARAAADTQARQTRDKIASATTGRNIDSTFDPDPPPPGTAPNQVTTGRGAPVDPD